jgi:hypothetical protein
MGTHHQIAKTSGKKILTLDEKLIRFGCRVPDHFQDVDEAFHDGESVVGIYVLEVILDGCIRDIIAMFIARSRVRIDGRFGISRDDIPT